MNNFDPRTDLFNGLQLAAILDIKYSDLRWIILHDPERLPRPLWLSDRPSWPAEQIKDWVEAGHPRCFGVKPHAYLPACFRGHGIERPTKAYAGWQENFDHSLPQGES